MNKKYVLISILIQIVFNVSAQTDTLFEYRRPLFDFDYEKPVFRLNEEQSSNKNGLLRFSVVTGYREGIKPVSGLSNFDGFTDTISNTRRVYMYNLSIVDMITHGSVSPNHIILEVKDPSKYQYEMKFGSKDNWLKKNGHCFELMLPLGSTSSFLSAMSNELSYWFGVKFGYENRMMKTLVLYRTSTIDKIKSFGVGIGEYNESGLFHNLPLDRLDEPIFNAGLPLLIDETGYQNNVDLDLGINSWSDLPSLIAALKKYDLGLKEETREVKMFIIKEVK